MLTLIFIAQLFLFGPPAEIVTWLSPKTHDFGLIEHNRAVSVDFRFQNTTAQPLLIDNVRTTCGCTVPEWEKGAILPDSTGVIRVQYDAQKRGTFRKRILVFFSAQRKAEKLFIEGEVR